MTQFNKQFLSIDERRKIIEQMACEAAKRTPNQQLKRLDDVFGKDQGATKERGRLYHMAEMGFGNTPKEKMPKDWHLGKNSKGSKKVSEDEAEAVTKSSTKRNHPSRRRKGKKEAAG